MCGVVVDSEQATLFQQLVDEQHAELEGLQLKHVERARYLATRFPHRVSAFHISASVSAYRTFPQYRAYCRDQKIALKPVMVLHDEFRRVSLFLMPLDEESPFQDALD